MERFEIDETGGISVAELEPFFVGWGWSPPAEARHALVTKSQIVVAARLDGTLVGFATALTDGAMFAYLSCLEVLPEYQGHGLGRLLVERVIDTVKHQYDLATITDQEVVPFYEKLGFRQDVAGVHLRFRRKP